METKDYFKSRDKLGRQQVCFIGELKPAEQGIMMDGSVMMEEESLKKQRRSVQCRPVFVAGQLISSCVTDTQSLTNVAANLR